MGASRYVFDASADNFRALVLENSDKGPVLVNYWSPRAGPCLMLMPRLVRLATEFGGRFLLVMLNTDELGPLAREHGVTSIPTIKMFRRGQAVDSLHGAESETVLREFIARHLAREAESKYTAAILAYQNGDLDRAVAQAAEAALAEPDNPDLAIDLVKMLVLQRRYAQADDLLKSLPDSIRELPELRHLSAHVSLIRSAQDAPASEALIKTIDAEPDNLEARYRLSAVLITRDDYEAAMEQLLEIVRRDSGPRHQAGRDALLAIFTLLGEDDERVHRYRVLLNKALH
ncbi:MAG: tetratricopeptide repeat protein [Gammaproteobacteria bacterium]|nr:tetratricopeptide repeat protein [Gammaproteobacteria bacterium]